MIIQNFKDYCKDKDTENLTTILELKSFNNIAQFLITKQTIISVILNQESRMYSTNLGNKIKLLFIFNSLT